MKKRYLFAVPLLFLSLTACGYKVPKTKYDKVKVAFNGVESSFQKLESSSSKKASKPIGKVYYAPNGFDGDTVGYDRLALLFLEKDIKGHSVDELSYSQPPMVQFQCLKKVFDKVGNGFEFGTKYYDNITGEVYVDFSTGFKDESKKSENKYNYDYLLGIDVNIDDNDLIIADVCFDVKLSQDSKSYETIWYVKMTLDYEMSNETPTYKLDMHTQNDEKDLPFFNRYTYENDYVDVRENKINEWRKFCMHSSKKLVKDETHVTFSDYINEGDIEYKVDHPKVFINGNYYKSEESGDVVDQLNGDAYFQYFECYDDPSGTAFLNKTGSKNSVIKDIYKDFSKVFNEDLAYNIVCREEDDKDDENENKPNLTGIRAMATDGKTGVENYVVGDVSIDSLFSGYLDGQGQNTRIDLWYADETNHSVEKVKTMEDMEFSFTCGRQDNQNNLYPYVSVNKDTTILDAYDAVKEANNTDDVNEHFLLKVRDTRKNLEGVIKLIFDGSINQSFDAPELPKEAMNLGIPSYDGRNIQYSLRNDTFDDCILFLNVDNTNLREFNNYLKKMVDNGFTKITSRYYTNDGIFKKNHGNNEILFVTVNKSPEFGTNNDNKVWIEAYLSPRPTTNNKVSTFPSELTQMGVPTFESSTAKFIYESINKDVLFIYDAAVEETKPFEDNFFSNRMTPYIFSKVINDGKDILSLTKKTIFDNEYICYEIQVYANPNYVEPEQQNTLEINSLVISGDFNQWNPNGKNPSDIFEKDGNSFRLINYRLSANSSFKMVANENLNVTNESTNYDGFGYDDVTNIAEFGATFAKGENGKIVVNQDCVLSIAASLQNNVLSFNFKMSK